MDRLQLSATLCVTSACSFLQSLHPCRPPAAPSLQAALRLGQRAASARPAPRGERLEAASNRFWLISCHFHPPPPSRPPRPPARVFASWPHLLEVISL